MSALTKIFIVLQLVCALVVGVLLVVVVKGQANYRADAEAKYTALVAAQAGNVKLTSALAAKQVEFDRLADQLRVATDTTGKSQRDLQDKLRAAELERDAAKAAITNAENKVSQLTAALQSATAEVARQNPEIQRLSQDNAKLIGQNAELARQNNELVTQLSFAGRTIKSLQEEIQRIQAAGPKGGASNASDTGTVASLSIQTPAQINGKVTKVDAAPSGTLVQLPLGTRDGVRVGTQFTISRSGTFIADVKVTKVTPDECVAATTENVKKGESPKAGDIATSGNAQ